MLKPIVYMSFLSWSIVLLISISLTNCSHHRKRVVVQGDVESATRHFNDTTGEQLYIETQNDSTSLIVHGKNWYKPSDCTCDLAVFLDQRPVTVSQLSLQPDGSFSFVLGDFSIIMRHTLLVTQKKTETEYKQSQISFHIMEQETGKENDSAKQR
jgi:hypothetical protein